MESADAKKLDRPVWITTWALTRGIIKETQCKLVLGGDSILVPGHSGCYAYYAHKGHWFFSEEDAKARARILCQRKIASLEKQIAVLKKKASSW